jgi:hypothetical protein
MAGWPAKTRPVRRDSGGARCALDGVRRAPRSGGTQLLPFSAAFAL